MNDDKSNYILRDRGVIEVKGKGSMNTYILIGKGIKRLHEPNDSFSDLPIAITKSKANDQKQPIKITDTNSNTTKKTKSKISKSAICVLF